MSELVGCLLGHAAVVPAMRGDFVAAPCDHSDEVGMPLGQPAEHEERAPHAVRGQQLQQFADTLVCATLQAGPGVSRDSTLERCHLEILLDVNGKVMCNQGAHSSPTTEPRSKGRALGWHGVSTLPGVSANSRCPDNSSLRPATRTTSRAPWGRRRTGRCASSRPSRANGVLYHATLDGTAGADNKSARPWSRFSCTALHPAGSRRLDSPVRSLGGSSCR